MIFAHAPAGFIISYFTRRYWRAKEKPKKIIWLYVISMLGGIFPDVDLLYYYFSSATFSHHEIFTHSFIVYLVFCLIIFLIGVLLKNHFLKISGILFFGGVCTHLATDSIGAGIVWLYPFSHALFGLDNFAWYHHGFGYNYFAINYIMEGTVFFMLVLLIIKQILKKQKAKWLAYPIAVICYVMGVIVLLNINNHLFHGKSDVYYSDYDQDGIMNKYDCDLDGDNIDNIDDNDIDNDGMANARQMALSLKRMAGVWYDPTDAGFIEIPLRMGFVTNANFIERCFANMGIFFRTEMEKDYEQNPEDYFSPPSDRNFEKTPQNWQAWLSHEQKLLSSEQEVKLGDILFFSHDYVAIALKDKAVLEASEKDNKVIITTLEDIQTRKGLIFYIGRLIQD